MFFENYPRIPKWLGRCKDSNCSVLNRVNPFQAGWQEKSRVAGKVNKQWTSSQKVSRIVDKNSKTQENPPTKLSSRTEEQEVQKNGQLLFTTMPFLPPGQLHAPQFDASSYTLAIL